MKKNYLVFKRKISLVAFTLMLGFFSMNAQQSLTTQTFAFTGAMQTLIIPQCTGYATITCVGARGVGSGGFAPGLGGFAQGVLTVTPNQVLNIFVGGFNGYNGGGAGLNNATGGGASDVRTGGVALTDRVIVAGGGGGAGGDNWQCLVGNGDGGGAGSVAPNCFAGSGGGGYTGGTGCGTNGTALSGGIGGSGYHGGGGGGGGLTGGGTGANANGGGGLAGNGVLGIGGNSGTSPSCVGGGTGGGGGGYYGGGGAAGTNCGAGRGGGGSSWSGTLASPAFTAGTNNGNGYVIITYGFSAPSLTIASSNSIICSANSATLTASGAVSYTWSNGSTSPSIVVNPLANTSYSVIGTGTNNCPPYGLYNLAVIPLPVVTANSSNNFTVCPTTPIILSGGGANTYVWSGGITNGISFPAPIATTVYTVTGTNTLTGCSNVNTAVVSIYPASLTISPSSSICSGGSATLSASGGLTYTWSANNNSPFSNITVSPLVSTVYTVNALTSNFCPISGTVAVTVAPSPTVSAVALRNEICKGESTSISASGASNYAWSNGASTASITVSPTITTIYGVVGTSSNNCSSANTNVTLKVNFCTALNALNKDNQGFISVYPNPSSGEFTINSDETIQINIVNELGQIVKSVSLTDTNNHHVTINNLSNGIYFIVGKSNNKNINQKIIVNK